MSTYIFKRQNGFYYIIIRDDVTGKQQRVSTKTKNKSDAMEIYKTYVPAKTTPTNKLTISEFILLLKERLKDTLRESTMWQYTYTMELFQEFTKNIRLIDVTVNHIEQFKLHLLQSPDLKLTPNSANVRLRSLKACFGKAVKYDFLEKNPCLKVPLCFVPLRTPRFLTVEDFNNLLKLVEDRQLRNLFTFAMYTGCRLSEVLHIQWYNVDMQLKQFLVGNTWNFTTKSGRQRTIPLNKDAYQALQDQEKLRYKKVNYVFHDKKGFPLKKDYVSNKFRQYRIKAKLPDKITFHSLRHSFISLCLMKGIDINTVRSYAGHADLTLISKVYGHLTDNHRQSEILKLDN